MTDYTPEELAAMEPCLIHKAWAAQDKALTIHSFRKRPGRHREQTEETILAIYNSTTRTDNCAQRYGVSETYVRRIRRGTIHADITGHKPESAA